MTRTTSEGNTRTLTVGRQQTHLTEIGCAPAVLMLHGGPESSGMPNYASNIAPLSVRFRPMAPDLPGCRKSTKRIDALADILKRAQTMASGQMGRAVNMSRVDEISLPMQAVKQSGCNLRALADDIAARAGMVEPGSLEITNDSHDLSSRTEGAASSLVQTAEAMQEITATAHQNSDTAQQTSQLASSTSLVAVTSY